MYDEDPQKRCFHCILSETQQNRIPIGEIHLVSVNDIFRSSEEKKK